MFTNNEAFAVMFLDDRNVVELDYGKGYGTV